MIVEQDQNTDGEHSLMDMDRARIACLRDVSNTDVGGVNEWVMGDEVLLPTAIDPTQEPFRFSGEVVERWEHRTVVIVERDRDTVKGRN